MRRGVWLLAIAMLGAPALRAAGDEKPFSGGLDVGYRNVTVDGNEDKYREDVNLADDALRLFGLDLAWHPGEGGWLGLDELTLDAANLGNEPEAWAQFRARDAGRWDLTARYRKSDLFYHDAGYFFRDGGDLHTWETDRSAYGLDLRVKAASWVTLRAGADRMERDGLSTTSRDLQRDVFVLTRPVDQRASSYWVGADFHAGWADVTVEQRQASYENDWVMTAEGEAGEDPGGATIDAYEQRQAQDSDTPISRITFAGHPAEWLRFSAGYLRADADLDYRVDGAWSGLDFDDQPAGNPPEPYSTTLANSGSVERAVDIWSADVTLRPIERVELTLGGASRTYDQDGTIDSVEQQTGGKEAGTFTVQGALHDELSLDDLGLTVRWDVLPALALSAGVSYQERKAELALAGPEVTTERTLVRAGVRYRPGQIVDLRVDYEQGSDDGPYTQVSPTDTDRLTADVRLRATKTVRIGVHFKDETRENDLTYPLGLPTDDVPPATEIGRARFDVTSWGASVDWARGERLDLSAGYDRTEIDSDADIVYVTGFTAVPVDIFTTLDHTGYASNQDVFRAALRYDVGRAWSVGARASLVSNDGTFPLDWTQYGAEGRYRLQSGLYFRVAYDYYELDESNPYAGNPGAPTPDVNDYQADLWTAAVGYRF